MYRHHQLLRVSYLWVVALIESQNCGFELPARWLLKYLILYVVVSDDLFSTA